MVGLLDKFRSAILKFVQQNHQSSRRSRQLPTPPVSPSASVHGSSGQTPFNGYTSPGPQFPPSNGFPHPQGFPIPQQPQYPHGNHGGYYPNANYGNNQNPNANYAYGNYGNNQDPNANYAYGNYGNYNYPPMPPLQAGQAMFYSHPTLNITGSGSGVGGSMKNTNCFTVTNTTRRIIRRASRNDGGQVESEQVDTSPVQPEENPLFYSRPVLNVPAGFQEQLENSGCFGIKNDSIIEEVESPEARKN
ncbi:hypothetical protein M413DRAFT_30887 [Hebeloma cylindrosporum]|uniref:Uncharacterized protein n=1 Tax=Hebeloma cylindrosporum TaxID=76867 RepID=A0A0C3C160_HEBCY|nr:hypothetical protein M413DRAFT_30887 [Hebeloma cylindrosporum h7]